MKRRLSIALRVVISVVLLVLLFREHSFLKDILPRLGALARNWPWVLAGLGSAFAGLLCGATRWFVLLRGYAPRLSWTTLARTEIVAAFFNVSSLGVVGGDAYKIMSISRRLPGQTAQVGVSLMLDHLTGFVAVGVLFFGCFASLWPRWEALGHDARLLLSGFSAFMAAGLAGLLLCWFMFKPRVLAWGVRSFPGVTGRHMFARFAARLAVVHDVIIALWRRALVSVIVSFAVYGAIFTTFYCALRSVDAVAPFADVMTAMPVVDAMAALPISVSGLGVRERTFEALLSSFAQVPEAACVSAAFVGWLFSVFWGLLGGVLFLRGAGKGDGT